MQYCLKCKVKIAGDKQYCPLCQGELRGRADPSGEIFPNIPKDKFSNYFVLRLISFIAIAAMVVCVTVNVLLHTALRWSFYVCFGIACAWITGAVGISRRSSIVKNIIHQMFLLSALSVVWDLLTGWRGWSVDYVIPCACTGAMVFMFVMAVTKKIDLSEYLIYLMTSAVYGIIPAVFALLNMLSAVYPSAICIACSIITIAALLLFQGRNIRDEIIRKFHM